LKSGFGIRQVIENGAVR